jgi:hypothetical protein
MFGQAGRADPAFSTLYVTRVYRIALDFDMHLKVPTREGKLLLL